MKLEQEQMLLATIAKLAINYKQKMDEPSIKLYQEGLYDLDSQALLEAVNQIILTDKWMPSVAEIREAVLIPSDQETSGEAWDAVCGRIQRFGRNGGTQQFTTLTQAAIRACGGFDNLCRSERPDNDRFVFQRAYEQLAERNRTETLTTRQDEEMPAQISAAINQIGRGGQQREELAPVEERAAVALSQLRELKETMGRREIWLIMYLACVSIVIMYTHVHDINTN